MSIPGLNFYVYFNIIPFMSLISLTFLIFMIVLLIAYYMVPVGRQWGVLLLFSLAFYMWVHPYCVIFLGISVIATWYLAKKQSRTAWLLTLAINLGILIVFRYSIYFGVHDLIVPLGISFYTFMTLGYAHDCYQKKIEPEQDLLHYALFITYFPQITEGPIGTYQKMQPQLLSPHSFDMSNIKEGGYRIIKGLFKKLVIAGRLTYYVDTVFSSPKDYGGLTLIIAVFFYAIELYADFSGYMDIVCGISKMLGIELAENFRRPYFSRNIQEYWRRWHITLNEWFKEHLMLPAVTSKWNIKVSKVMYRIFPKAKKGTIRTIFPLILVWVITGIWHGAEAVYMCWGIYFAIVMLISFTTTGFFKKLKLRVRWNDSNVFIIIFQTLRTFLIVLFGEVMFRSHTMNDALLIYKKIFTTTRINADAITAALVPFGNGNQAAASSIILAVLIGGLFVVELRKEMNDNAFTKHRYVQACIMMTAIALFGIIGRSNFMYQQF